MKTVFTEGDPAQGIPATTVTDDFLNAISNHNHYGLDQDGSCPLLPNPRNFLINGAFDIWQRGVGPFASSASGVVYTADRCFHRRASYHTGSSVSQVAGTVVGSRFGLKMQRTAGNADTAHLVLGQVIENLDVQQLAGKSCILTFWAKGGGNISTLNGLTVAIVSGTGVDEGAASLVAGTWTGSTDLVAQPLVITQAMAQYKVLVNVPANAKEVGVYFQYTPVGVAGADDSITFEQVRFGEGVEVLPFRRAGEAIAAELQLCRRYLRRYSTAQNVNDLAYDMRVAPTQSGAGPYFYDAEL